MCWVERTISVEADDQTQPASRSSFLSGVVISDWRTLRAFDHLLSDVYPSLDWLVFNAPLSHVSCPRALSTDRLGHRERAVPRLCREGSESYSCAGISRSERLIRDGMLAPNSLSSIGRFEVSRDFPRSLSCVFEPFQVLGSSLRLRGRWNGVGVWEGP